MTHLKNSILIAYALFGLLGWYSFLYKTETKVETNNYLSTTLTETYVKSVVWYHSRGKLQELRMVMLTDNLSDHEVIKRRIENLLKHRSSAYIREFNQLDTPIPNLGDWYVEHFDFDSFLDEIFSVVFDENLTVGVKIRDITDIMEKYQNQTSMLLRQALQLEEKPDA